MNKVLPELVFSKRQGYHKLDLDGWAYRHNGAGYTLFCDGEFQRNFASLDPLLDFVDRQSRKLKLKNRPCLCCRKVFVSEGAHNRLCSYCSQKSVGIA